MGMQREANTTYIEYAVVGAGEPVELGLSAIADNRVFHNTGQGGWPVTVNALADGVKVVAAGPTARPLTVRVSQGSVAPANALLTNFYLPQEDAPGLSTSDNQ